MLKVYGTEICKDCRAFKALWKERGFELDYTDITENTANLREFLKLRDTLPVFDEVRKRGGIGIPLFLLEDGTATFDVNEALASIGEAPEKEEAPACETCR